MDCPKCQKKLRYIGAVLRYTPVVLYACDECIGYYYWDGVELHEYVKV